MQRKYCNGEKPRGARDGTMKAELFLCREHWRHVLGSCVLAEVGWEVVMVSEHLLCS